MNLSEYSFETQPFKHQVEAICHIIKNHGKALLYCEPGTGKTKMLIDFAGFMYLAGKGDRVFVSAPLSGIGQWEKQIQLHLPKTVPYEIVRLVGSTKDKIKQLKDMEARTERTKYLTGQTKLTFVLMNYGSFHNKQLVAQLIRCGFDLVCADECHRIANATTAQSKALWNIGQSAKYRVGLTGTPIRNKPTDFFGQVRFVDPFIFSKRDEKTGKIKPMTWTDFQHEYALKENPMMPHLITGIKNAEDVYAKVNKIAFKRRKDECLDLPDKLYETMAIPLTGSCLDAYIAMSEQMIAQLEENAQLITDLRSGAETDLTKALTPREKQRKLWIIAKTITTQLVRLRQIACGIGATEDEDGKKAVQYIGDDKLKAIESLMEELKANNRPAVLFCCFKPELARFEELCKKRKWSFGTIHGGVKGDARDIVINNFQDGKLDFAIIQIAAGSESMNLFRSSDAIYCSIDWSYVNMNQSEARIHRIGQKNMCTYYYVVAEGTVEEDILDKVATKQEYADVFMSVPKEMAGSLRRSVDKLREQKRRTSKDDNR